MIPYVELRWISLGGFHVAVQPLLGATAILLAHFLFVRRARRLGLSADVAAMLSLAMAVTGLGGAYLFRWVYLPEALARDPWIWTKTSAGASSFGGLLGGLLAALAYFLARRIRWEEANHYLDALAFVFPQAWIFGRIGCSLVHDHPGIRSASILAVRYPGFPRYDLAVLEVLFLLFAVVPLFLLLDRRHSGVTEPRVTEPRVTEPRVTEPRASASGPCYFGLFLAIYGLFRVALDQLHIDPPRYLGFTVDSLAYGSMALGGLMRLVQRAGGKREQ